MGSRGIRMNAIAPGPIPTGRSGLAVVAAARTGSRRQETQSAGTLWHGGGVRQPGGFLVSDGSAYINGEVVTMDGGEWLQGAANSPP